MLVLRKIICCRQSALSYFRLGSIISLVLLISSSSSGMIQHEKPVFQIGFEGNSSVYRWANGYREQMIPTFNTTREARRSVVSGGLFSVVSFDNVPCNSDSGEVGTCYSNRECKNLGGTSSGICAGSYGTCCVVHQTCGSTISANNSYFVNPDYPSTSTGPLSCSVTITNLDGATELYLEFLDFDIRGPSGGLCRNDTFTVTVGTGTTTSTFPILCGNNTGQAVYIPIGPGTSMLTFNLVGDGMRALDGRLWKIRIVQFKNGDACAAPPGCDMYYREPTGTFQSFNFNNGMGESFGNYCINACFAINQPNCGVLLTEGSFMLSGMAPSDCDGDYLQIGDTKYCGDTLNNGMIMVNQTMSGYAQVKECFTSNNADMDLGFSLNYSPITCAMVG